MVQPGKSPRNYVYLIKPFKAQAFARILLPFDSVENVKLFVNSEVLLMAKDSELAMLRLDSLQNMNTTSYYMQHSDEVSREVEGFNHSKTIQEQLTAGVKRQVRIKKEQLLQVKFLAFDDDLSESLNNRVCLLATDHSKKLYLYVVDTQRMRLDSVKEGTFGWNNVDIRDRCFNGDYYVRVCSSRLSPQTKLFALQSKKGYIDFYLNLRGEKIMSTKNYESVSSQQCTKYKNLSLHKWIEIGTEALYTTLPDGSSFAYPFERDLV